MPLITAYAMAKREPRKLKRLYDRRDEMMNLLKGEYAKSERK
jgi:deoxyhypusine synthase